MVTRPCNPQSEIPKVASEPHNALFQTPGEDIITPMKHMLLAGVLMSGSTGFCASTGGVEANFLGSVSVYTNPLTPPTVAYNVPAGDWAAYYTRQEVADDVTLSGTDLTVASIQFSYYANYAESGGLTFRIYDRNSQGTPGSLLYTSAIDLLSGGGAVTIPFTYDPVNNILPQRFFYSFEFTSAHGNNRAGMFLPNRTADVGYSADIVYEKRGSRWLPIDFRDRSNPGLGLVRDKDKIILYVFSTPLTKIRIRGKSSLSGQWFDMGETTTDAEGFVEFNPISPTLDAAFYQVVTD